MKTMNNNLKFNRFTFIAVLFIMMSAVFTSCDIFEKDMEGKLFKVSDEKMMDEILEAKKDSLSDFLSIIDKSGLRGTVHAYGTYTLFAPTNKAVQSYLTAKGLTLAALTETQAADIVKYHLLPDTIPSSEFVDGRLPVTNFSRKFITTQTVAQTGGVKVIVNRQGNLLEKDIRAGNGYVHIVDQLLYQSLKSIHDVISELPESYSLYKEVYTKSGIASVIDAAVQASPDAVFTCFIQDDAAFAKAGISSYTDLITELKAKTPQVTNEQLLVYNYMAYHFVSGFKYVVDLFNQSALKSLVEGEVIVLKKDVTKVLLNEFLIGGILEEGAEVDRSSIYTDLSCSNGVVHKINGNIQIVKRQAFRVYWDFSEQPELMAMKNFRKKGAKITIDNTDLAGITWAKTASNNTISYECNGLPSTITKDNNYVYGDYLYFRLSTNTMKWIEFTTPVLAPGTYKVWFSYRGLGGNGVQQIKSIFKQDGAEEQIMGIITTGYNKQPASYGLTQYNQEFFQKCILDGYRNHMINSQNSYSTSQTCQALGIIQVLTTGQHKLRMEPLKSAQFTTWWDQILFIPIDEDQIWPMQDNTGKWIYQDTKRCEIYPYADCSIVTDSTTTE